MLRKGLSLPDFAIVIRRCDRTGVMVTCKVLCPNPPQNMLRVLSCQEGMHIGGAPKPLHARTLNRGSMGVLGEISRSHCVCVHTCARSYLCPGSSTTRAATCWRFLPAQAAASRTTAWAASLPSRCRTSACRCSRWPRTSSTTSSN